MMRRKWRRWQRHLSVARVTLIVELLIFVSALLFMLPPGLLSLTGSAVAATRRYSFLCWPFLLFCTGLLSASCYLELITTVKQWCAGAPQYDDMTFVVMKVK